MDTRILAASNTTPPAQVAPQQQGGIERRLAKRVPNHPDDYVTVNGVRLQLRNWSRTGLLFGTMANPPRLNQKIEIKVAVLVNGERLRFDADGEVLRVVGGEVAVRYQCMTSDAVLIIKTYFSAFE